jgi:hypothetical protein
MPDGSKRLSVSSIMDNTHPLVFACRWNYCDEDNFVQMLNGILDDVLIYDRALAKDEVELLHLMGN